jgi:hypothetical protein
MAEDVEALVLDPCYRGTCVEDAARVLPCGVEWHDGFRLSIDRLDDCRHYRGSAAAEAVASMSVHGVVTPRDIGLARFNGMDNQLLKWAWHYVARFGHL